MELQAALQSIHLYSTDPLLTANFYGATYDMQVEPIAGGYRCSGPGRELNLSAGPINQLKHVHFALNSDSTWQAFNARVMHLGHCPLPDEFANVAQAVALRDPDGNLAEISSEIEHCAPGRPAGLWPHEERTLNLWGKAILRS